MSRGSGSDLAGHAAKAFLNELLQTPTCTVTGKHGKIVNMDIRVAVRICDLIVIDLAEPVVCGDRAAVGKD